ncbi:dehydrogenase [Alicyclobacillus ferrooxydans]|uniref:Dehydrogenase n=1 Tax=Alicyclobacillus ferrooxydans TaxID=471514 RepID=A0A0P9CEH3_9BACL|nr:dehydrogenase [Alicyclobacillus ferrooxydans]
MNVKVVVIGAGTMGSVHAEAYASMPGVELRGIVDPRLDVAQSLAEKLGSFSYSTLDSLLMAEDPDVVDVCVPTPFHKEYIVRAAKAGKHIISEKPLDRNLSDAEDSIRVCKEHNVRLFVGQVVRFFPEYRSIRQQIVQGKLGQVGTARTFRGGSFPSGSNDWYANSKLSGTIIVDLLIHDIDFLRWCFGDVERVYAKNLVAERNRLDHAYVSLKFQNGVIAHLEGTWSAPSGFSTAIEVAGDKGLITHNSDGSVPIHSAIRQQRSGVAAVEVPSSPMIHNPYFIELEHFIHCIRTGDVADVEPEDALAALKISLAAVRSAQSGEVVTLSQARGEK